MRLRSGTVKAILLALIFWLFLSWLSYTFLAPDDPEPFDFFPRWVGARQMLVGEDPYSLDAQVPPEVYDGNLDFLSKPYLLYPATITYLLLPFWLVSWEIALSVWCGLTLLLLLMLPLIVFIALNWHIRPWLLAYITFLSLFVFRHSISTFLLGQFTIFILACLVFAWWFAKENRPVLAALVLLGATIRPEGMVFTAGLLALFLIQKQVKVVMIWCAMMGVLVFISMLQIGFWLPDFLDGIRRYQNQGLDDHPAKLFPYDSIAALNIILVILWGGWMLWQVARTTSGSNATLWGLSILIVVGLLVLPQSRSYTLVYLLLPLWLVIWEREGHWQGLVPVTLLFMAPWLYLGIKPRLEDALSLDQFMTFLPPWTLMEQFLTPLVTGILLTVAWKQLESDSVVK